ncbi:RNA-directed DNA polymerase, eukaryota, reverse transcriptase zinc-binding domain protein [Tanacetum coccineum]|uniref:RNA-directed DNA polymerase, eukaryota, reverse transcriptase zinc-binding domain protein n=1 Tax=Tanacetum coccineum TaxID=301880 RepID=A0ABQ5CUV2_9ASTR
MREREFKNSKLIELCGKKGIRRDYSNARTPQPQQTRVAERKLSKPFIEATRTMLLSSVYEDYILTPNPPQIWTAAIQVRVAADHRPAVRVPESTAPRPTRPVGLGLDTSFQVLEYLDNQLSPTLIIALASLDKGGLGVGSIKAFNYSLLLKCRWRMLNCPSALWVHVLKSIHGDEAGFDIKGCQTNGLWARIVGSIYHLHSSGYIPLNSFRFSVGDGSLVRFWKDTCSLDINVERDSPIFTLSTDNTFSVNVARKFLDDCLLPSSLPCTRWYKVLPRKVNIFMWRLFLDRLPHRLNLSSRGLDIESIMCLVCNGSVESNSHIFFSCTSASSIWRLVRGWCDLKFPLLSSCNDWDSWLLACQVTNDEKDRAYIIFASTCWTVWRLGIISLSILKL